MQLAERLQFEHNDINLSYQSDNLSHSSNQSQPSFTPFHPIPKATKISRSLPQSTIASSSHSDFSQQPNLKQQYEFYLQQQFNINNNDEQLYCQQFYMNGSCMKGSECRYLHGNQKDKFVNNGFKLYNKMWMDFPEIFLNNNDQKIGKCLRIKSFLKSMK